MQFGERLLQLGVVPGDVRVLSDVVAEPDVVVTRLGRLHDDVEVMPIRVRRPPERLASGNPQISLVLVTERFQALDRDGHCFDRAHDNRYVDHGLRRETGYGSATNVLDGSHDVAESLANRHRQSAEARRPLRVVVRYDDEVIRHRGR